MNAKTKTEIREIVDDVRDAIIYGDIDTACDGLDRIISMLDDD